MEQENNNPKDAKKNSSTMRFMSKFCLFISLFFGVATIYLAGKEHPMEIAAEYSFILSCIFLGSAFGGKVTQKLIEVNPNFLNRTK